MTQTATKAGGSRLIGVLTLTLILGLVALIILASRQFVTLQTATQRYETHLVERAELFNLFAYASATEATHRNYLLTRDQSVLPTYQQARANFEIRLASVEALPEDILETTTSFKTIARNYAVELDITDMSVILAQKGQFDEAAALVEPAMRRQSPRQIIPALRTHYALMARQSGQLQNAQQSAQDRFGLFTIILMGLALLLGALLTWVGRENILRLRHSERLSQEAETARLMAEGEQERVEVMMREMNHRVGNSLSMVMSLLGLQRSRADSPEIKTALKAAQERVLSVANAQRRLRFSVDMRSVDVKDVLEGVVSDIRQGQAGDKITLQTDLINLMILDRDAVTIALLMNELIANAVKHAFTDRDDGLIHVSTFINDEGHFVLDVSDNGSGFETDNNDAKVSVSGFGTSIIDRLARQFGGEVGRGLANFNGAAGGGRVTLTLKALHREDDAPLET